MAELIGGTLTGGDADTLHHAPLSLFPIFEPTAFPIPDVHGPGTCGYKEALALALAPLDRLDRIVKDKACQVGDVWLGGRRIGEERVNVYHIGRRF